MQGRYKMAKLYFRYGAMNCGKTTNLMQVAHNYKERGMTSVILKPKTDKKGGSAVISRLGITRSVDMVISKGEDIIETVRTWIQENGHIHCILVDEVQFLVEKQIDELFEIAVCLDIPIICYGLRTDFKMNGFPGSRRLLLLAHSIEELKTVCRCGKKALLNGRKINGNFVFEGKQVAIDGVDAVEYESLCPKCYYDLRRQSEGEKNEK